MVKKFLPCAVLALVVLVLPAGELFAQAYFPSPSVNGPTGLVRMPSADVLPYRNLNIGFDYGTNSFTNKQMVYYKMNVGTFQGLELGIVGGTTDGTEGVPREGVFINMKYSLAAGGYDNPLLLAIGVENLSSYYQTDVYMVATRSLKDGPKIHFGFMGDFPGDKFRPLGMFGLELPFWENFVFMSDLMAGETIFQTDVGLRVYLSPTMVLNVTGLNITYDESTIGDEDAKEYKDPKSVMIGLSMTNPF